MKKQALRTFHDFTDEELKSIIKLRLSNEKFTTQNKITKIQIDERRLLSVTAQIHSKNWQPEYFIFCAFKKCYANEFLLLTKLNFDFKLAVANL